MRFTPGHSALKGDSFEQLFSGLSQSFPAEFMAAIRAAAPNIDGNFDVCLGGKERTPTPNLEIVNLPRAYVTDALGIDVRSKRIG